MSGEPVDAASSGPPLTGGNGSRAVDAGPAGELARRQGEVVAALTGTGGIPAGFDHHHLETARRALLRKRASELRFVWPILIASLGPRLHPAFAEFAAERPTRGARADGHAFAQWLRRRGELPLAAALERAEARLHWYFPDDPAELRTRGSDARGAARNTPPAAPSQRTSYLAVERFPGGMYVRRGSHVTMIGRPTQR